MRAACCVCLMAAVLAGCLTRPDPLPDSETTPLNWFKDVTDEAGLDFVHDAGDLSTYFMPASMGSGCAFLDFDGDGLLDIYLTHLGGPKGKKNQLFRQVSPGKFQDVSAGSGLDFAGVCQGIAVGDIDNDGRPDVVVTLYGGARVFLNQGGGKFEDITSSSGVDNPLWGSSAALLDFDRDGWLDLVVVNYLDYNARRPCFDPKGKREFCGPAQLPGTPTKLFRNLGGAGKPRRFEDVTFSSGIGLAKGPGLGVTVADIDGDSWPDIFVSNDGKPNQLWINKKDGTFKDEAVSRGVATTGMGKAYAGMGVARGDVFGSGMLDLFVAHLGTETHTLWKQGPRGLFSDATVKAGLGSLSQRGTGFGTLLADFDLNGTLDLAIVNGRVIRGGAARDSGLGFWEPYAERNQLFVNDGNGRFRDISAENKAFCGYWNVGRGLACADYDNDGALDLLVTSCGGKARLFRNVAPDRGHWLKVRVLAGKRDAYGAEVRVRTGNTTQLRLAGPAESYLSSGTPLVHFGLGKATAHDGIEVVWPDGSRESFPGGPADRVVVLRQGGRMP